MFDKLRRRIANSLRQSPAGRADRVRHVRGRLERLEPRTVLSASLGPLPSWTDGAGLVIEDTGLERAEYAPDAWMPPEVLGAPHFELPATSSAATDAAACPPTEAAEGRWEDVHELVEPPAPLSLSSQYVGQPTMAQSSYGVIVFVPAPLWGGPGTLALVFPPDGWPTSPTDSGGSIADTAGSSDEPPLASTSPVGAMDADDQGPPQSSVDARTAEPNHTSYPRPPVSLSANPTALPADAWYSLLVMPSTSDTSTASISTSSEGNQLTTASLSAYDTALETYTMQPLSLVWDIGSTAPTATHPTADDSVDSAGQSQGGFVELRGSDLGGGLLTSDAVSAEHDAIDAVLANLNDDLGQPNEHARDATPPVDRADAHSPIAPRTATTTTAAATIGLAEASADEGGMILLRPGDAEQGGDYSLAAVYMISPDKLLEVNVEMDASIGIYQAFDVAAGDLRPADGKPVKTAEPVRTRAKYSSDDGSTPDAKPAAADQAAAWVTTLFVATSLPSTKRRQSDRRDRARSRR